MSGGTLHQAAVVGDGGTEYGGDEMTDAEADRVALAHHDVAEALRYFRALKEFVARGSGEHWSIESLAVSALAIATVIAYARPFKLSHVDEKARTKIDPKAVGLFDGAPDLEPLHTTMLDLRDKAVAHADWTHHSTQLVSEGATVRISTGPNPAAMLDAAGDVLRLLEHVGAKLGWISWQEDLSRREGSSAEVPIPTGTVGVEVREPGGV